MIHYFFVHCLIPILLVLIDFVNLTEASVVTNPIKLHKIKNKWMQGLIIGYQFYNLLILI